MTAFNVAGLLHEAPGATRDARLRDHYVTLGPDVELAGPLDADLRLQRTNRGILVRGEVRAPLRRTCARCTDAYVEEVTVPIGEEDAVQRIDEHHEIDLAPTFHDELSLTEPMHPLCRPDCPGLCSTCGEKLDRGTHAHDDDEIDPRLAGLAALLGDRDGDGLPS